jgi:hypothetical protein
MLEMVEHGKENVMSSLGVERALKKLVYLPPEWEKLGYDPVAEKTIQTAFEQYISFEPSEGGGFMMEIKAKDGSVMSMDFDAEGAPFVALWLMGEHPYWDTWEADIDDDEEFDDEVEDLDEDEEEED